MRRLGSSAHDRPVYLPNEIHDALKAVAKAEGASTQFLAAQLLIRGGLCERLLTASPRTARSMIRAIERLSTRVGLEE